MDPSHSEALVVLEFEWGAERGSLRREVTSERQGKNNEDLTDIPSFAAGERDQR
jgi:hypothetical protein